MVTRAPSFDRSRFPPVIIALAIGTFLVATGEFISVGLLPQLARDLRVDVATVGLTTTVFAVGAIIGSPVTVLMASRLTRRTALVLALVMFAVGHIVAALSGVFAVLLAARFVAAIATGGFWALASVVAAEAAAPGASAGALGVVQAGAMLANVLGVPLGSLAGQLSGWRGPLWILAGLALGTAVLVGRLTTRVSDTPPTWRRELVAPRSGRLWLTLLTCVFVTGGVFSVFSYISPLLTERAGLSESVVPLALVLFGVTALVGGLVGGRFGDARPYATALTAAVTALAAIVGLGRYSTHPVLALVAFGLLGLVGLSANPVLSALVIRFGDAAPLTASALLPAAFNIGTALGTGITSLEIPGALGYLAPTVVGGASAASAVLCLSVLRIIDGDGPSRKREVIRPASSSSRREVGG